MATLTQAQGVAILSTLRIDTQAALQAARDTQQKAETGLVHGAFALFGLDADSSVDAVPGDLQMQLHEIDTLDRTLPAAVLSDAKAKTWLETARAMQANLRGFKTYQETATVDSLLGQTAEATAATVEQGVSAAAKGALSFTWKALPWWAWTLAGLAAFFFLVPAALRRKVLPA